MPKKEISRKVQRTPLLSQVSFESFFSVSDKLDQLTTSVYQLAGTLDQVWGLGLVQWQKLLQVSAIAMVIMVICVNLRMTDPRKFFWTQGTLHGPDKFQHSRGISSLCASHAQRCSIVVLGLLFLIFEIFNETDNVSSVYTSGRKCNFQKKGCEAPQVREVEEEKKWFPSWAVSTGEYQRVVLGWRQLKNTSHQHS